MDLAAARAQPRIRLFREGLGLHPFAERWAQAKIALQGQEDVPPSSFDRTSLSQLRPRVAWPLWRGRFFEPRRAIVTNLFNHTPTPIELGWSVRKTQARDFRGRDLTYDSHNGTDFSIPVGTPVLAAAPGEVVRVVSEFNRGGLKVFIDHGEGLFTTSAHLARALVREGQRVARGEAIALSGYSGLDALVTFPFGTPHVHFNTWLDGEPVDPFPHEGHASLWRAGDLPEPMREPVVGERFAPSDYSDEGVAAAIAACKTASSREELSAAKPLSARAGRLLVEMNYYPTRFPERPFIYQERHGRAPRLDLPFPADAFDGIAFVDDLPPHRS
ncbi:MAG: M23 family metallopeptidase [Planctomycetota bacterium]